MNNAQLSSVPARRAAKPLSGRILPERARGIRTTAALLALALFGGMASEAASIGWNQTAVGPFDYNDPANWVDGNINGLFDISAVIPSSQTVTFGADTVLTTGLTFNYDGSSNETLRGTGANRTLTLGGDIVVNTVSTTRTVTFGSSLSNQGLIVDLGGVTRTFTVGSGRTLGFVNPVSNGGIIASGGSINFSGANTYTGNTVVNSGTVNLNGAAGSSALSDFILNPAPSGTTLLSLNSGSSGNVGTTRAKSVTLNGGGSSSGVILGVTANPGANSVETITNAVTAGTGFSTISVAANAARNARLEAGSFVRNARTTVLIRGTDLGVSTVDSVTAGDANIRFGTVTLTGGGGTAGQSTIGIIKGAYGDISSSGNGVGLVTHDSVYGVRLLATDTEYAAAISDGGSTLHNVLYARASGTASQDTNLTTTVNAVTSINSLSFRITGAGGNSGVTISGDVGTTLRLASGMIFASQSISPATGVAATDAMVVSVPNLDLNGQEGVFIALTNGISNGNTSAPLQINSSIGNDGGNGVTIGGTGQIVFGGSTAHSYTGVTTINSGILRLNKSVANIGIPGDLVMNGGTLLKNGNAIPDTATVTLNGGTFVFDSSTSSGNNGHPETFQNLVMNGGGVSHHGDNATLTITGNATITENDLFMNRGGDLTIGGLTTLNGGTLIAKESSSSSTVNALTTLGAIAIQNTASSAYTPIELTSSSSVRGGKLTFTGDLTFTGNATNSNSAMIAPTDSALANQGTIALRGTRNFDIGNGAATTDLTIVPSIADDGANVGGITKAGAGTLALNGDNLYTGPTNVSVGKLIVGGSLTGTSSITVSAGATLATDAAASLTLAADGGLALSGTIAPGGEGSVGVLTATLAGAGKLTFASGSKLALDLALLPANSDLFAFGSAGDWLAGTGLGTLQLGGNIDYDADYTVFSNVTTAGFGFAGITGYDTANYSAQLAQLGTDYILSFTAIPEPGSAGLLACAVGLFAGGRRFRGRRAFLRASSI